jgi:hypothetical protein
MAAPVPEIMDILRKYGRIPLWNQDLVALNYKNKEKETLNY